MRDDDGMAALLGAFTRDVAKCSAQEVAHKMRQTKKYVVAQVRARDASVDVATSLAAWAASVALGVRHVLERLQQDATRRRDGLLQECIVALEDVTLTSYHLLRERAIQNATAPALDTSLRTDADAVRLRGAFSRVLQATTAVSARSSAAWVDLGLLLSLCWVLDRNAVATAPSSQVHNATELLETIITQCNSQDALAHHAAWSLFAQGLIFAVSQRDEPRGLQCLRKAAAALTDGDDARRGGLFYWYAVLLSRAGQHAAAIEQLCVAVTCNYRVVAALNLHALLAMERGDLYEASAALERSVDVDFSGGAESMFNYAVLLQRMGSHEAQYQMLEYYTEATTAKRTTSEVEIKEDEDTTTKKTAVDHAVGRNSVALFPEHETARLFACSRRAVGTGDVALQMAMAATASGAWCDARERFEEYFTAVGNARAVSQTARRHYAYVLLQCNRPTDALAQCELAQAQDEGQDLWVAFYKSDALLCLERVDECEAQLKNVIEPQLARRIEAAQPADDELIRSHVQLLNNLAVAAVCRGNVDAAVAMLRDCARTYATRDDIVAVQFNLTLLLWRLDRRDAACALWFEARGWSLQMDVGDMREQHKALAFVSRVENEALCSGASRVPIASHVNDASAAWGDKHNVDVQQLRYLDALVLHHWGNAQDALATKTAAQYVEYLETLTTKPTKPPGTC